ncbi:MAG: tripartite tricarboxylate transporter TctB family protein [Pseudomonadota bacterium]
MLTQRTANLVFVALILAACGYFAWVAEGFVTSGLLASSGLPSKFFPQLMLAIVALCAVIVGYQYLVHGGAGKDEDAKVFANGREAIQGILMLVVAVACYAVWRSYGFLPMAIVLGPLSLLAMGVRQPVTYVVVLSLTAAITLIFMYGLGVQLL